MPLVLDQYAPGGCFKQISDAAGNNVEYYQYHPGGVAEQLRLLVDPTLVYDQYVPGGCAGQLHAAVESGGDGGGSYVAQAVHIDSVRLHIDSLTSTDNPVFSFVGWVKPAFPASAPGATMTLWISDAAGKYGTYSNASGIASSNSVDIFTTDAPNNNYGDLSSLDAHPLLSASWQCLMGTIDMATSSGKFYVGDVDRTRIVTPSDPFNISSNGFSFDVLSDGAGADFAGDVADWRIMPGVSLLTGGDIVQATRRLFIDANGKPVDPAVATAALGAQCILFSGDATTFSVNQGTGGSFTLVGSLIDASTSPSG